MSSPQVLTDTGDHLMDIDQLEAHIDAQLADADHLVLVKALEQIGPCTYAEHLRPYVKTRIRLHQLDRWWWSWEDRPPPIVETTTFMMPKYWHQVDYDKY